MSEQLPTKNFPTHQMTIWEAAGHGFEEHNDVADILKNRPLLAHYTSTSNVENILRTKQIWLSHPLMMNDLEEVWFGMMNGMGIFQHTIALQNGKFPKEVIKAIDWHMGQFYGKFSNEHLRDIYVTCFAEHSRQDFDGLLSMFRAYAAVGNGAALVFNTDWVQEGESPFIVAKIRYGHQNDRIELMKKNINQWWNNMAALNIEANQVRDAAWRIFFRIVIDSLTYKHSGFHEEKEWRMIYFSHLDHTKECHQHLSYLNGSRGLEPKLKLPLKPLESTSQTWTLPDILDRIILGPSIANMMARQCIDRMLDDVEMPQLKAKVHASTIPLRPTF